MEDIPIPVALPKTAIHRDRPAGSTEDADPLTPVPGLNSRYDDDNNARADASSLLIGANDDDDLDNGNDDDADDDERLPVGKGGPAGSALDVNDPYAGLDGAFGAGASRPSGSSQRGKEQEDLLL
ncbi:hypothetical protein FRC06_011727 [Ceratobasidium sp. 370]|nr:hypothetical protein FRC06_011727 [Ceratobasidium sp. 370]